MRVAKRASREGPAFAGRVAVGKFGGPARESTLEQREVHERGMTVFNYMVGRQMWKNLKGPAIAAKTEEGSLNQIRRYYVCLYTLKDA